MREAKRLQQKGVDAKGELLTRRSERKEENMSRFKGINKHKGYDLPNKLQQRRNVQSSLDAEFDVVEAVKGRCEEGGSGEQKSEAWYLRHHRDASRRASGR